MTLYVTDLDGTLLLPDRQLGQETAAVLAKVLASGHALTYATARSYYSAEQIVGGLDWQLPVITYGGAILVDPRTGVAETAATLPETAVRTFLAACENAGAQPLVFLLHGGTDRVCWLDDRLSPGVADFLRERPGDRRLMPLNSWSQVDLGEVFYLSVIDEGPRLLALRDALPREMVAATHLLFSEDVYVPGRFWLELSAVLANKGHAVRTIRDRISSDPSKVSGGVPGPPKQIACFGDQANDLSMFEIADEAYAMANAHPDVRAKATAVIGSNADQAVAAWFRHRFRLGD